MSIDRALAMGATASTQPLDGLAVARYIERVSRTLRRHRAFLDRLDAALGDGDHGENMTLGFHAVLRSIDYAGTADLGGLLRSIGHVLVESVGGASGPLYGTAFIEAGFALRDVDRLDGARIADAFDAGARGLSRRGRCAQGDKTILDALLPAAHAFREGIGADRPLGEAVRAATWAAHAGMRATIPMVARRGLALRLGERSRGHQDPGATSCFLLVRAMLPPRSGTPGWQVGP
jgi:dihydroxyacetone kinase-like protein